MRPRTTGLLLAALVALALAREVAHAKGPAAAPPPLPPPAGKDAPGLPPLPEVSPRNASYTIEARLDPEKRTITGSLVLDWRNTSDQPLASFPFHLYWNAFRNNLSTTARGEGRRAPADRMKDERSFGWTEVKSVKRLGGGEEDLTPTLSYLNEDGNTDDRTVMQVRSAAPVASGRERPLPDRVGVAGSPTATSGAPAGSTTTTSSCSGSPRSGCSGRGSGTATRSTPGPSSSATSASTTSRSRCRAASWWAPPAGWRRRRRTPTAATATASCRRTSTTSRGRRAAASSSGARASTTPAIRRWRSGCCCSRSTRTWATATSRPRRSRCARYGTWSAPYPYPQITVVDPAWGSASGGMEYPTLFTGGALGAGAARAAEPGGRHDPRGRPPVLVRARGQQRVRGGLARRGLQQLHDVEGHRPLARSRGLGPPLLRRRLRARRAQRLAVRRAGGEDPARQREPGRAAAGRRGRRDGEEGLDLPRRRLLRPQLVREARARAADARGPARRGDDGQGPADLRAALSLRAPDHGGLPRDRRRGDRRGLALVLQRDVLLRATSATTPSR